MTPIVEAHGLTKRFGKVEALAGLDLAVDEGQVVALLGPNGAGKTTFVRTVATLLRSDEGSVCVAGHDVVREADRVRRLLGLAGQHAAVEDAMTGRENLEMVARLYGQGRRAASDNAAHVLERLGLTGAADRLVRTYSGGMRRRLDLGASLVGRAAAAVARRADDGSGPSQPDRAVGRDSRPRRERHRRVAHDPVPRRGRSSRRPHRDHRPRSGDRRRHAERAQDPGRSRRRRGAHRGCLRALGGCSGAGSPEPDRARRRLRDTKGLDPRRCRHRPSDGGRARHSTSTA